MVYLYSQPGCAPCKLVKQQLNDAGIEFVEYDITTDPSAYDRLKRNGFNGTPVLGYDGHLRTIDALRDIIAAARPA